MIYTRLLPLYEARIFLINYASGVGMNNLLNYVVKHMPSFEDANKCFDMLSELKRRLESSISIDDAQIDLLFTPIRKYSMIDGIPSLIYPCDMLIRRLKNYTIDDFDEFFNVICDEKNWIPSSIVERLLDEPFRCRNPLTTFEAIRRINDSGMIDEEKMKAFQILIDPDRYITIFEQAMRSVASVFQNSAELYAPLIDMYYACYKNQSEMDVFSGTLSNLREKPKKIDVYPSIMAVQHYMVSFVNGSSEELLIFLGTLMDLDEDNPKEKSALNASDRLLQLLKSIGNQSRYMIMCRLSQGPAYGRELAAYLNLSPGTVSQHLSILAGLGLIDVTLDGAKLYYSINREQVQKLIQMQNQVFLGSD